MKKFLIAAALSFVIFGGQAAVEASTVENLNEPGVEIQDVKSHGKWAHFRDKYILGRETENERRDRKDWERRHRYNDDHRYSPPPRHGHRPPPPPRR